MKNIPLAIHVNALAGPEERYSIEFPIFDLGTIVHAIETDMLDVVLRIRIIASENNVNLRDYKLVVNLDEPTET